MERRAEHGRVADLVYAPSPGPAGQLGVLARCELLVPVSPELGHLLDHHRARRHVDAEGEGLGGEDDLYEGLGEARLNRLAKRRHHAGVVRRQARFEPGHIERVAEHGQVLVCEGVDVGLDDGPDAVTLLGTRQPEPGLEAVAHRLVASRAGEHEVDGGKEPFGGEGVDDLFAPRAVKLGAPSVRPGLGRRLRAGRGWPRRPRAPPACSGTGEEVVEPDRLGVGAPVNKGGQQVQAN